jgi:hypothetical protein
MHFAEKKLENLKMLWQINWKKPWYVPVKAIRDYYGEKIALYFMFLGFYTRNLFFMGIIGFFVYLL